MSAGRTEGQEVSREGVRRSDCPLISVVVPVYNAAGTLTACVDSILGQSLSNFELLLVDDGSTDGSSELCDGFLTADGRVTCIHQPNGGQAAARMAGVAKCRGEWLTFVDADDMLTATALQELAALTGPDVDIVLGNGESLHGERRTVIPMDDFRHLAVKGEGQIGLMWGSLYRRSSVTPRLFDVPPSIRMGEDYIFWLRLVFQTDRPVRVLYKNVYNKGADHFCSAFEWTADYAAEVHHLRKQSIPEAVRGDYMAEMIEDRMDNLFSVAVARPRREWVNSRFYREIVADISASGYRLPLKRRLFLMLPSRGLRMCYSHGSNVMARMRRLMG